jgi:N-acetyl-gamma-glutamyl-phosphate reductase
MVGQRAVEARRSAGQAETGDVSAVFNKRQKYFSIKDSEDTMRIEPESMNGIYDIEIHVFAALARRQALLIAKFDNLGKGASEVAVQNLMLLPGR